MTILRSWVVILTLALLSGCVSSAERERREKLADTYTQLGVSYMQRGQLEVAKDNFDKAIALTPDSAVLNNMMALLLWRLKNYSEAEQHFRKSLDADPENSDAWNNYGVFMCERGKLEDADKAFKRALANPLYRTPAEANVNAGMCQMRKPSPTVAEKYFRAALDINPRQGQALLEMAKLTFGDGRTLSARAFITRFFEAGEDTPQALLLAVKIERALGNSDAEASYAVRLRGKFPESTEASQLQAAKRAPAGGVRKKPQ
jgi:type IV pilus assembly protein PilF